MPHNPYPAAYSVSAFAERLSVSRGTVYNLIRADKLRVVKIGARTLIPATELDRILADAAA